MSAISFENTCVFDDAFAFRYHSTKQVSPVGSVFTSLVELLYPERCASCGIQIDPGGVLCWKCIRLLEPVPADECDELLHRLPSTPGPTTLRAAWFYDKNGPLQKVVQVLKYSNAPWYGARLGQAIAEMCSSAGLTRDGLVVPVPLHRTRYLERGYNQAEWIARPIASRLGRELVVNVLRRAVATRSQTTLSRADRWSNVSGSFKVIRKQRIDGCSVVLVDDVVTTGATVVSAATALQNAGAREVAIVAVGLSRD